LAADGSLATHGVQAGAVEERRLQRVMIQRLVEPGDGGGAFKCAGGGECGELA